ncbi:MAG: hypothetical protein ABIO88_07195 [Burkholderiaceae bacterium]
MTQLDRHIIKSYLPVLVLATLILGFSVTAFGLYKLKWPQALIWADANSFLRFAGFLAVASAVVSWLTWRLKGLVGLAVLFSSVLLVIISGALWSLLVTLWFAAASALLGSWLLVKLKIINQSWVNNFLVGAGVYGTVIGLLAHFPINYPGVYGILLAIPFMLDWRIAFDKCKEFQKYVAGVSNSVININSLDIAIGVLALLYILVALMPELGYDSLVTHLFVPAHLSLRHQWGFDAGTYVWAVMPMLGDWIFSIGYMLDGETATRLFNVGFIFVLAALLREMVLWAGGTLLGARWVVLIFLSTPLTYTEGSSLYIESIWASFTVAGAFAVLRACTRVEKEKFELVVAGLLLGCSLAAKAVTFTYLPILVVLLIWHHKVWFKATGLQIILLGTCLFLVIGLVPYLTAWVLTGNPVFPMFNKIFQSPYYSITENFNNTNYNSGFNWDILYRITFKTGKYLEANAGASGFQWLLLFMTSGIALLSLKHHKGIVLMLLGIVSAALVFHSQSYLRYIFPSYILLMTCVGVVLSTTLTMPLVTRNLWYAAAGTTVVLNLIFINSGNAFYQDFPVKSVFDKTQREQYLLNRLPIRFAVELVNKLNIENASVAVFADPLTAGLSGNAFYTNWYNPRFLKEITTASSEQDMLNIFIKNKITYLILDSNWKDTNCCTSMLNKVELIEKTSEPLATYGAINVRRVKNNNEFKTELLQNSNFKSVVGWTLNVGAAYDADASIMTTAESSSAYQQVAISENRAYKNTVEARCGVQPTTGRVQVNWLNSKHQFINASIKTFECSADWMEQTMEVTSPKEAASAVVYVSGHTTTPLEFKSNSLRQ